MRATDIDLHPEIPGPFPGDDFEVRDKSIDRNLLEIVRRIHRPHRPRAEHGSYEDYDADSGLHRLIVTALRVSSSRMRLISRLDHVIT